MRPPKGEGGRGPAALRALIPAQGGSGAARGVRDFTHQCGQGFGWRDDACKHAPYGALKLFIWTTAPALATT